MAPASRPFSNEAPDQPGPDPTRKDHTLATTPGTAADTAASTRSLVSLLGEPRAAIVEHLRHAGGATVAELAGRLGVSDVATRRHLAVLEDEGLVGSRTERDADSKPGRGRPAARYVLTDVAARLFPQGYDRFAAEVLDFLSDAHGRDGLREFLRWRLEREVSGLRKAVTAEDLHGRLEQLAAALSDAGFRASVGTDGEAFTLTQDHCAIFDVAREHPEVCAYEAASFSQVLGRDVTLSRRETLAGGYSACVCCVSPRASTSEAASPEAATPKASAAALTAMTTAPGSRPAADTTRPSTSHDPGRGDEL